MTEMKHTPTPWNIEADTDILDANGACIATTLFPNSDVATQADYNNAAFIVRAVNAHDALVEACCIAESNLSPIYASDHLVMRSIRAALTQAKSK